MIETIHAVQSVLTFLATVGSVVGLSILTCSVLDGYFMLYDWIVRGIGVFDY